MVFRDNDDFNEKPVIKVIGVGGGGGNAVDRMIENDVKEVMFVAINTDAQVLKRSKADERIQIGRKLTRGLGAGAKADIGREAALESIDRIKETLQGVDMIFITTGMGGGTGTGASPVIAKLAKEMGILTVAIVTKPFTFEGQHRMDIAIQGLEKIKPHVDTLIVVPNQRLLAVAGPETQLLESFKESDNILRMGVQGISEIITYPSVINLDFADVKTVMENKGTALLGIGSASGENRAVKAARQAIHSKLLEITIDGATDALVHISSGSSVTLFEVEAALEEIRNATDNNLKIIYGNKVNVDLEDEMIVTVVATGYELKAKNTNSEDFVSELFNKTSNEQFTITEDGIQTVTRKDRKGRSADVFNKPVKNTVRPDQEKLEKEEKPKKKTNLPSWLTKK